MAMNCHSEDALYEAIAQALWRCAKYVRKKEGQFQTVCEREKKWQFQTVRESNVRKLMGKQEDTGERGIGIGIKSDCQSSEPLGLIILDDDSPGFSDVRTAIEKAYDIATEKVMVSGGSSMGHGGVEVSDIFLPIPTLALSTEKPVRAPKGEGSTSTPQWKRDSLLVRWEAQEGLKRCPWVTSVYWFEETIQANLQKVAVFFSSFCKWQEVKRSIYAVLIEDEGEDKIQLPNGLKSQIGIVSLRTRQGAKRNEVVSKTVLVEEIEQTLNTREDTTRKDTRGILMDLSFEPYWFDHPVLDRFSGLDLMADLKPVAESPDRQMAMDRYRKMGHPAVVVLTGYADKEHILLAMRSGADDYVMKSGRHGQGVDWEESITRAFHALFVLHARRLWLQWQLCRIGGLLQDCKNNKGKSTNCAISKWRKEVEVSFPTGGVPSFIFELHQAVEELMKEMEEENFLKAIVRRQLGNLTAVEVHIRVKRIRQLLAEVPDLHQPLFKDGTCECCALFGGTHPNLDGKRPLDYLRDFFQEVDRWVSRQITMEWRRVPREI
ncbi:MAG: response regulator [Candidatus Woesearchaeota archaeon]